MARRSKASIKAAEGMAASYGTLKKYGLAGGDYTDRRETNRRAGGPG